jgi:hypothetical protein
LGFVAPPVYRLSPYIVCKKKWAKIFANIKVNEKVIVNIFKLKPSLMASLSRKKRRTPIAKEIQYSGLVVIVVKFAVKNVVNQEINVNARIRYNFIIPGAFKLKENNLCLLVVSK